MARPPSEQSVEDVENISPWTEDETKCLINLWGDGSVQAKLEGMYRNKSIYESISRSLRERGFRRTWLQCQRKIKSLKTKYKEIKDCNNKSGAGRNNFPFYDLLDSILGDKPSVRPLMVLDSSVSNEEGEEEDLNSGNADEPTHSESAGTSVSSIRSPTPASSGSGTSSGHFSTHCGTPSIAPVSGNSSGTTSERGTTTSRKRKNKMEAALDVFAKKMGEVLEKDNHVLLQMQAAQHQHEMAMMTFLGQLIKDGQSQRCPPVPPSHHSSFPPGASHQPPVFQPVLPPYQQGSRTQQHTYLPRMPQPPHTLPQTSYLQDLLDDQLTFPHDRQT